MKSFIFLQHSSFCRQNCRAKSESLNQTDPEKIYPPKGCGMSSGRVSVIDNSSDSTELYLRWQAWLRLVQLFKTKKQGMTWKNTFIPKGKMRVGVIGYGEPSVVEAIQETSQASRNRDSKCRRHARPRASLDYCGSDSRQRHLLSGHHARFSPLECDDVSS